MGSTTQTAADVLSMQHITKIYGNGFMANKDICFSVRKGEIHGLVGENGAGVRRAYLSFRKAGMRHLDIRIYPGMRHEILNETARSLVYEDVLSWLQQRRVTQ